MSPWMRIVSWSVLIVVQATVLGASTWAIEGEFQLREVRSLEDAWQQVTTERASRTISWVVDSPPSTSGDGRCSIILGQRGVSWKRGGSSSPRTDQTRLFLEIEQGRIRDLSIVGSHCRIDAAGVELEWWQGISTEESYGFFDRRILTLEKPGLRASGAAAVAHHRIPEVDSRLERLVLEDPDEEVRHSALFWLGSLRGAAGFEVLRRLESRVSVRDLQEALIFGYYVSEEPAATRRLLDLARSHSSTEVRSHALFWIAQEAGEAATATLERAAREDPEREVKESAVFGLAQLPEDEGIPALLRIARSHPQPEVREIAFFWLGQSEDPRALDLFEEVLGIR